MIMKPVQKMKSKKQVLFSLSLAFVLVNLVRCEIIEIKDGRIEGSIGQSWHGQQFHAFRKIPFAEPPVGELRFKAPIANKPWTGTLNCTSFGPMCMQANYDNGFLRSEDCLHVNVFTKNLPSITNTELKPVIAFVHGGAFEAGSAIEHGPEYLMDRDLVVVTINYRLGAFGFMALGTPEASGNQGLKDQSIALKWIQQNIRHFGGDPEKVTLTGLSAGGYSVTAQMVSPMSQGLFANVIAMSGAIAWQIKLAENNIETAKDMAQKLDCPLADIDLMAQCLRNKTDREIADNMITKVFHCPKMSWLPVIEPDLGQKRFFVEDPSISFRDGKFPKMNVIAGITSHEFISPVAAIFGSSDSTAQLNDEFDDIAPSCFFFEGTSSRSATDIAQTLRDSYLPFDTIDIRSFDNLNKLFADGVIGYGVHKLVHLISNFTDVYYYKFSYVGQYSGFNYPRNKPYGVHHGDDIQYLFNAEYIGPQIQLTDPESVMVERMTRIWEQFATTGNPNNISDEFLQDMNWPKHDTLNEYFLEIGNHLVEKNGLFLERFTVWESIDDKSLAVKLKGRFMLILIAVYKVFF